MEVLRFLLLNSDFQGTERCCVFTMMQTMIKWLSLVDCQTALQITETVKESSRKITVALSHLKPRLLHRLAPPPKEVDRGAGS